MQNREIVERWFSDVFTRGDDADIDEVVHPDFIAHGPGDSPDSHGREAFRTWLRWYLSSFSDPEWTVDDVLVDGDRVAARYSGWTTYRGGLLDIPSNDQRVLETGIIIFRIVDGQVREIWSEMSDLQVIISLGAFPCEDRAAP
ncbi:MAG TPA: ester cyclase [Thermomicrobiales bacterium]|nr:ester cyclase [Thermomicrobiales bacterium]